jgi:hypothetical protein
MLAVAVVAQEILLEVPLEQLALVVVALVDLMQLVLMVLQTQAAVVVAQQGAMFLVAQAD